MDTGTGFNYQAKDASGNPFLNMQAFIRTSDPKEPFDQQSIQGILSQQGPSYATQHMNDYIYGPHYEDATLALGSGVRKYVQPVGAMLDANRDADMKARIDAQNQQVKMGQAVQLAQLINGSNSVDNRRGYSALAKMFGINVPDDSDQFVGGNDLLKSQISMNDSERNYNLEQQKQQQQAEFQNRSLELRKQIADRTASIQEQKLAAAQNAAGAGGGLNGKGIGTLLSIVKAKYDYADKHPGQPNPFDRFGDVAEQQLNNSAVPPDFDDYNYDMSDANSIMENSAQAMANGQKFPSRQQLEGFMTAQYGDLAPSVIGGIDWGDYGY